MKWDPKYSIVPSVDNEHRKLFELIEKLHIAMKGGQGRTLAPGIARELMNYTATHFENEIRLLRQYNYPGVGGHEQEHNKLLREAKEQLDKIETGSINALVLMSFLENWITNHVLKHDMAYRDHLIAQGAQ